MTDEALQRLYWACRRNSGFPGEVPDESKDKVTTEDILKGMGLMYDMSPGFIEIDGASDCRSITADSPSNMPAAAGNLPADIKPNMDEENTSCSGPDAYVYRKSSTASLRDRGPSIRPATTSIGIPTPPNNDALSSLQSQQARSQQAKPTAQISEPHPQPQPQHQPEPGDTSQLNFDPFLDTMSLYTLPPGDTRHGSYPYDLTPSMQVDPTTQPEIAPHMSVGQPMYDVYLAPRPSSTAAAYLTMNSE